MVEVDGRRGPPRGRRTPAAGGGAGRPHRRRRDRGDRRGGLDRQAGLRGRASPTVSTAARPSPAVVVVQALPKGDRGELAVEVLTEVGVAADRAVGGRPQRRGLEGRAGREVAGEVAVDGARGRQAGPARRGSRRSTELAAHRRRRRAGRRRPTSPSCCTRTRPCRWPRLDVPGDRAGRGRGRPRGRPHRRGGRRPGRRRRARRYGWAPRCCAPPPPASPPSPPCCPGPPAGPESPTRRSLTCWGRRPVAC